MEAKKKRRASFKKEKLELFNVNGGAIYSPVNGKAEIIRMNLKDSIVSLFLLSLLVSYILFPRSLFAQTKINFEVSKDSFVQGSFSEKKEDRLLTFKEWKQQQVLEAENQVVRASNNLLVLKSKKLTYQNTFEDVLNESQEDLPQSLEKKDPAEIAKLEKELEDLKTRLEVAKDLNMENYFSIYLVKFKSDKQAIGHLVKSFDKEDVALLLNVMFHMREESISHTPVSTVPEVSEVSQKQKLKTM